MARNPAEFVTKEIIDDSMKSLSLLMLASMVLIFGTIQTALSQISPQNAGRILNWIWSENCREEKDIQRQKRFEEEKRVQYPGLTSTASSKKYQVTGKVLELTDTVIVVEKGDEKWEIAGNAQMKVQGDIKIGANVTIEYRLTATAVKVKMDKAN